ncbi:hypothetical protein, partial [Paraglaciecola marina]|uniref:hypothetical protein n=1 Tax=Paraglaciecola marina TaxID=2500157 RepID=UPI0019815BAA
NSLRSFRRHIGALYSKRCHDLLIKKNIHLALWPIAYAIACYEKGFVGATISFSFVIYLCLGALISIRVLSFNLHYFRSNALMVSLQLLYLSGFIVFWFSTNPIDRTAIWLALPFLCGLALFSVIKLYQRLSHASGI